MANPVLLSGRDRSLLRLLSWTPVTTTLLLRASSTFDGDPFHDERRLRERLQALADAAFVRSWSTAHTGGGLQNYYKLTPTGFQALYGADAELPPRAFFAEISPALFEHTPTLAEVIVQTLCGCHTHRITINRFFRTRTIERAYHIFALTRQVAVNKSRRVVYAATQESYLAGTDPVRSPIFLDHSGQWQSLVDLHPTARHRREPVRLPCPLETGMPL